MKVGTNMISRSKRESSMKRKYCLQHPAVAVYSLCPFVSMLIHGVEHDVDDFVYASSEYADDKTFYHKCKIHTDLLSRSYFKVLNLRIYLDECIRINLEKR